MGPGPNGKWPKWPRDANGPRDQIGPGPKWNLGLVNWAEALIHGFGFGYSQFLIQSQLKTWYQGITNRADFG